MLIVPSPPPKIQSTRSESKQRNGTQASLATTTDPNSTTFTSSYWVSLPGYRSALDQLKRSRLKHFRTKGRRKIFSQTVKKSFLIVKIFCLQILFRKKCVWYDDEKRWKGNPNNQFKCYKSRIYFSGVLYVIFSNLYLKRLNLKLVFFKENARFEFFSQFKLLVYSS